MLTDHPHTSEFLIVGRRTTDMARAQPAAHVETGGYELRFRSLSEQRDDFAFPCDSGGHVDLDELSERSLNNYLYARTLIGRDFLAPAVQGATLH
jgi:hypothetical protein